MVAESCRGRGRARRTHQEDDAKEREADVQVLLEVDIAAVLGQDLLDPGQPKQLGHTDQAEGLERPEVLAAGLVGVLEVADVSERQARDEVDREPALEVVACHLARPLLAEAVLVEERCPKVEHHVDDEVDVDARVEPERKRPQVDVDVEARPQRDGDRDVEEEHHARQVPDGAKVAVGVADPLRQRRLLEERLRPRLVDLVQVAPLALHPDQRAQLALQVPPALRLLRVRRRRWRALRHGRPPHRLRPHFVLNLHHHELRQHRDVRVCSAGLRLPPRLKAREIHSELSALENSSGGSDGPRRWRRVCSRSGSWQRWQRTKAGDEEPVLWTSGACGG